MIVVEHHFTPPLEILDLKCDGRTNLLSDSRWSKLHAHRFFKYFLRLSHLELGGIRSGESWDGRRWDEFPLQLLANALNGDDEGDPQYESCNSCSVSKITWLFLIPPAPQFDSFWREAKCLPAIGANCRRPDKWAKSLAVAGPQDLQRLPFWATV